MNLLAPGIAYSDALSTNMIAKTKPLTLLKRKKPATLTL